jgi:putative nucleotidyltransferase with HDIG domain
MMSGQTDILALWPELDWIESDSLRASTARAWEFALQRSPLTAEDLQTIPFTLLHPTSVSFMAHKRCVVHIAREAARAMQAFMGDHLPIDLDTVVAGAILADVGKLLEYEPDPAGGCRQSARGKYLRHPFTGVSLCMEAGLPDAVSHIVATHAGEGNLVARTTEAWIVHHADFMSYEPVAKRLLL